MARLYRPGDSISPPPDVVQRWWQLAAEVYVADGDPLHLLRLLRSRHEISFEARELVADILMRQTRRKRGDHSKKLNVIQKREILGKLDAARIVRRESMKTLTAQAAQLGCEPVELRKFIDERQRNRILELANEYCVSPSTITDIGKRRPKSPRR